MADMTSYDAPARPSGEQAGNVLELLDRILDKGLVIVGDIRVSVADIELLKIQIRLLIASVDKAKELGIDFSWAKHIESTKTKEELENKIKLLESQLGSQVEPKKEDSDSSASSPISGSNDPPFDASDPSKGL
jgi:hypothetical protein